jgi:MSHA biogenesis protein MshP
MRKLPDMQRGFAAMAAIFLLVVLAALGAYMLAFSNTQQLDSASDVQGSRAYWAARAGIAWGMGSVASSPSACPVPPAPFVVDGFTLTVSCIRSTFSEGSDTVAIYTFTSTAVAGGGVGGLGYVERSVTASVEL